VSNTSNLLLAEKKVQEKKIAFSRTWKRSWTHITNEVKKCGVMVVNGGHIFHPCFLNTSRKMAAMFIERYQDILEYILDYLPREELESHALVSRSLAKVIRRKASRIRRIKFRGKAFAEDKRWYTRTVQEIYQIVSSSQYTQYNNQPWQPGGGGAAGLSTQQQQPSVAGPMGDIALTSEPSSPIISSAAALADSTIYGQEALTQATPAASRFVKISRFNSLIQTIQSLSNLRRLDLTMCRIARHDFRAALQSVSETLQDLRIEMIFVTGPPIASTTTGELLAYSTGPNTSAASSLTIDSIGTRNGSLSQVLQKYESDTVSPSDGGVAVTTSAVLLSSDQKEENDVQQQLLQQQYPLIIMKSLKRLDLSPPSTSILHNVVFPKLLRLSSYRKMLEDKCSNCNVARPSSKCGACKFYAFCTRECQMSNWNDNDLGHKRVCHHSLEVDSPQSVSGLILNAAKYGELRELDLAHYWHQNVLFDAKAIPVGGGGAGVGGFGVGAAGGAMFNDDDDDGEGGGVNDAAKQDNVVPVFSRPIAIRVLERLVSLRLLRCGVDDGALELISKNAMQLKALDISLNTKVTDLGLLHLAALSDHLEDLRLRQDYRLTDAGIRQALVKLPKLTRVDLRSGIKRLRSRGGNNNGHGAQQNDANAMARSIRITAITSLETLLALDSTCKFLKCIRIVAKDEHGHIVTVVPEDMKTKVECDSRGGIDLDDWGEPDEFYTPETL
jgi:hypothetical protein